MSHWMNVAVCCSVLQCVAVCCSVHWMSHAACDTTCLWTRRGIRISHATPVDESSDVVEIFYTTHMDGSRHTHVGEFWHALEWVMTLREIHHTTHIRHDIYDSFVSKEVMSHKQRSHVTHMNESCHTLEWAMSYIMRIFHVTHEHVTCHTWTSHATHMNKSCHTHDWVTPHTWMSHATRMNEWGHIRK